MGLKATNDYAGQAWTIAVFSIAACSVALAAVGVSLWLILYTKDFAVIVGADLRNVFIGYASLGAFMFVCGIFGIFASLTRIKSVLLSYAVLLMANLACYGTVWAYIYLQRRKVSDGLLESIEDNALPNTFLVHYLSREFNCSLATLEQPYDVSILEDCRDHIDSWLLSSVWILLGISIASMALQVFLLVTSLMLRQMVAEVLERNKVKLISINKTEKEEKVPVPREAWLQEPFLPISEQGPAKLHKTTVLEL